MIFSGNKCPSITVVFAEAGAADFHAEGRERERGGRETSCRLQGLTERIDDDDALFFSLSLKGETSCSRRSQSAECNETASEEKMMRACPSRAGKTTQMRV